MILQQCGVCLGQSSKYKCPKCYMPFCSVTCGKTHKDTPGCDSSNAIHNQHVENSAEDNEWRTVNTVPLDTLAKLNECSKLHELLQCQRLRDTLKAVDRSSNPEAALEEAMKDTSFQDFVQVCLAEVEPDLN